MQLTLALLGLVRWGKTGLALIFICVFKLMSVNIPYDLLAFVTIHTT